MTPKTVWPALLCTLALVVTACGNSSGSGDDAARTTVEVDSAELFAEEELNQPHHEGTPTRGGSITFGLESDIAEISPAKSPVQPADLALTAAVFDPLVAYGDDNEPVVDNTDRSVNQLAEEVTHPDGDLATWTVHLRDDVTFSNGEPVTAEQVIAHTEWVEAGGVCACQQDLDQITELEAGVDDQGRETVTYHLTDPFVSWPIEIGTTGLGWITETGARGGPDVTEPDLGMDQLVGAGAFVFDDKSGDSYTVVANDNYHGVDPDNGETLPYLDEITFRPLADAKTRLQALTSGAVDIIQTADTGNVADAVNDDSLVVQPVQGASSTILILNLTHPPFGVEPAEGESAQQTAARALDDEDARAARRAFAEGIDRNELNQKLSRGVQNPAYAFIPRTHAYFDPDGQLPSHDPAAAAAAVEGLVADGMAADVSGLCIDGADSGRLFDLLGQQAEASGFGFSYQQLDQAELVTRVMGGEDGADWEVACFRSPELGDPNGIYDYLHSGGSVNVAKYTRDDVDDKLDRARRTGEFDERKPLYDEVQRQAAEDVVYIPLLFDYYGNVYRNELSGLSRPNPSRLGMIQPGTLYLQE